MNANKRKTTRKTTEEFKEEVKQQRGDEYTVLGEYINNKTKIKMRHNCDKCNNYEYEVTPRNFLIDKRCCPKCAGQVKKNTEDFKKDVFNLVGDEYTVLGEYINNKEKILMRHNCDKCNNYEFKMRPSGFLSDGQRCPECNNIRKRKTTEEFKEEVKQQVGDEYIVLGEYKTNDTKILMKHNCDKCNNYEYEVLPREFLNNRRCPYCAKHEAESRAIKYIKKYLNDRNILFEDEKLYDGMILETDLKIDILFNNINIEYDGMQHFRGWNENEDDKEKTQLRDKTKNDYCLNNNLHLVRIPYTEEENLNKILDAIINYDEELLKEYNCLIIKNNEIINKPNIYSWYEK